MDKDKVFIEETTSYYTSLQRGKQNPTKRAVKVTFVTTENPTQRVARLYNKRKHNNNKQQQQYNNSTTTTTEQQQTTTTTVETPCDTKFDYNPEKYKSNPNK